MSNSRDLVRAEPGERIDYPDWEATQRNARTDVREQGRVVLVEPGLGDAFRVLRGFDASGVGLTDVTVTAGAAILPELLPDGATVEHGVVIDDLGDASKAVPLTGLPAATYGLWLKFHAPDAQPGSRVFYSSAGGGTEVTQTISTRRAYGWTVEVSATSPGAEYVKTHDVAWDGGAITAITGTRRYLFEGDETAAFSAAGDWGGGANDRSSDRTLAPAGTLERFAAAMRRQVGDAIGGAGWWAAMPQSARLGVATTLTLARDHIDLSSDPHGATLTQTNLVIANQITVNNTGNANGDLNVNGTADFALGLTVHDNILLAGGGFNVLPVIDASDAIGSESGYTVVRAVHASSFKSEDEAHNRAVEHGWGPERDYFVATQTGGLAGNEAAYTLEITDLFRGAELAGNGPYLSAIQLRAFDPGGNSATQTCLWTLERYNMFAGTTETLATGAIATADVSAGAGTVVTLDISAATTDQRKMTTYWVHRLVLQMRADGNTGTVPAEWGVGIRGAIVTARHKFLHP